MYSCTIINRIGDIRMFKREFKINLKSLIIWTVIVMALFLMVFAIYPSMMQSEEQLNELMEIFPENVLKMFNMDIESMGSAFGWIKTEGYVFLALLGAFYSAILGGTILVKEENDKTIEFLYSKPISRNKIVTTKILCGVINIFIFTVAVTIFNLCGLAISDDLDLKPFLLISLSPLFLFYMTFFIVLFVSTFMKKSRKAMSVGIGFVFISYFLQTIGNMSQKVAIIKSLSVFEFVSSRYIIVNNTLDWKYIIAGIFIMVIVAVGVYIRYNKKELVV